VVVDELKFGDNDNLGAMVTNLTESGLLVNLTNIDGLFDKDPRRHPDAQRIAVVDRIDRQMRACASTIPGVLGKGGMASKVSAARKVALAGVPTVIADGLVPGVLRAIFAGKPVGTLVLPERHSLKRKQHWIAFTKASKGTLTIDAGAERAVLQKGKSLLPTGIRGISGSFSMGNAVTLQNEAGTAIAIGMVNYSAAEIRKIMGAQTSQIEALLGYMHDDEVIHRDNLVPLSQIEEEADGQAACRGPASEKDQEQAE